MSNRIMDEKELFIQTNYVKEPQLFKNMRFKAREMHCEHMMVAPSEARVLQSLVEVHGAKKVVEIGTLYGYSAIYLAQGILGEGKVWTLEKSSENASIAKKFIAESPVANKIEVVVGDAHENLKTLSAQGPFDCVFIDADKAGYPDYLKWAEKNIRKNGLIIADNTFLGGFMWGKDSSTEGYSDKQVQAMREFHKEFSDTSRFRSTIYPSFDGFAVGIKI